MMIADSYRRLIADSVLCWLATASPDGRASTSPKEIFTLWGDSTVLIGNVASPQSAANINRNEKCGVSFLDIWTQQGVQCQGLGKHIDRQDALYPQYFEALESQAAGFPLSGIFVIKIVQCKEMRAPSYLLKSDVTAARQVKDSVVTYGKVLGRWGYKIIQVTKK